VWWQRIRAGGALEKGGERRERAGGGVICGVIAGLGVVNKSCNFCWQKLNFLLSA
jgi:hypothetical protein